jgi:predicted esterase
MNVRLQKRPWVFALSLLFSSLVVGCGAMGAAEDDERLQTQASLLPTPRLCDATPPPGATLAPPPPRYAGMCPRLVSGKNTITTSANPRTFLLAVPSRIDPAEKLPVVFLWHWLGGSADSFLRKGEVQAAVDQQRFIAVLPEAKWDMIFRWPFDIGVTEARQKEEFAFFDDMLACVAAQYNVNNNCVSSAGVSAGALFTSQLMTGRSQYLSSAISLSGGVGGFIKPLGAPVRKVPMMVLWGGDKDWCIVVDFNTGSKTLENELEKRGHFFLECVHNCGHGEPPFPTPTGLSKYGAMWQFVFDHPYWLPAGDSPYKRTGVPADLPPWCAIGKGKATPRTGMCAPSSC